MSSTTPSFTPPALQERNQDLYNAYSSDNCLLRAVSRSSLPIKNNELDRSSNNIANSSDVAKSWNVANSWNANSHFHRRSQLEARLVELQKDVASLTLQLRFSGNSRPLLRVSSVKSTSKRPDDELESLKLSQVGTKYGAFVCL